MPLVNFRDVADNAGPRLRPGLLYRSARPTGLTAAELAAAAPGLRCVVDLRGPDERTAADWAAADALGATVLNLPGQGSPTDLAALPPGTTLGGLYTLLLDHRAAWFASVVAELADRLPAVVSCAAGKDRTGLTVALVLDLVGVGRADIIRDYTATAAAMPEVLAALELTPANGVAADARYVEAAAVGGLLDAPEDALTAFLDALAERGGAERLLTRHGLTDDHVVRLRAALAA
ncbi:tyrosine-protein phosphatase [Streptomyces noursei]|uniref:tyrosine-protein phosphatase n=1 Tax=Streptomyces noursei TaxID=1971 RepID=UPI0036D2BB11